MIDLIVSEDCLYDILRIACDLVQFDVAWRVSAGDRPCRKLLLLLQVVALRLLPVERPRFACEVLSEESIRVPWWNSVQRGRCV